MKCRALHSHDYQKEFQPGVYSTIKEEHKHSPEGTALHITVNEYKTASTKGRATASSPCKRWRQVAGLAVADRWRFEAHLAWLGLARGLACRPCIPL